MTPLRQKTIEEMILKGFTLATQKTYLAQIRGLAEYFGQSPERLSEDDVRAYLLHCHVVKQWSHATCRQFIHAVRFLYDKVLQRPLSKERFPMPTLEQKLPELLSYQEVLRIFDCSENLKYRTAMMLAYGTGMRVSEVVNLQVRDLDGERDVIRVVGGKGRKDRELHFTDGLKRCLRQYWQAYGPKSCVFYARSLHDPIAKTTLQRAYVRAKLKAEIHKRGGIHALRHAYATHQLAAGMPLPMLQRQLGHSHIACTLRYTRWLRCGDDADISAFDLLTPNKPKS